MKFALHLLVAFVIGLLALVLLAAPTHAESCATVQNSHAIVYPSTVTATYAQQYQAVAVAVPLYSASAPGLAPEVTLLLQQISEAIKQNNALLQAQEVRLQSLERGQQLPLPVQPQQVPRQPAQPPAMPPAAQEAPNSAGMPRLYLSACAKCHDAGVASAKGGGFSLLTGGQELPLTCYQMLEMQDRITLDPTNPKAMPRGVQAAEEEVNEVVSHLKLLAKQRK